MTTVITSQMWHYEFINRVLRGHLLRTYTDGGPTDRDRAKRRAAGKRQRAARRVQRAHG